MLGFSWANLVKDPTRFNQIPRLSGDFFNVQANAMLAFKPTFVFIAMFDEVNESTAMLKAASTAASAPSQGQWLTLDRDGQVLPKDHYLQVLIYS